MNPRSFFYWLLVAFGAYLIFELVRKISGGSLSAEDLMIGLQIATLGFLYDLSSRFNEHMGWHKGKGELPEKTA